MDEPFFTQPHMYKVLADNVIERLPLNLGKLQYLKNMSLDMNRITILPDELGQLLRIEKLSISGNLLTHLPETIGSLRNLMLLNVSNNKLEFLPESIGSCFSLEELQANGDNFYELRSPRIRTRNTHGTGCTLASCIAAELAKGSLMLSAVKVVHVVKSDSRLANNDLPVDIQRLRCRALCYSKRTSTCYT